jgi:hypothetical protein
MTGEPPAGSDDDRAASKWAGLTAGAVKMD